MEIEYETGSIKLTNSLFGSKTFYSTMATIKTTEDDSGEQEVA